MPEPIIVTPKNGKSFEMFRYQCLNCGHVCYGLKMRYDFLCNRICEREYKLKGKR